MCLLKGYKYPGGRAPEDRDDTGVCGGSMGIIAARMENLTEHQKEHDMETRFRESIGGFIDYVLPQAAQEWLSDYIMT